LPGAKSGTAFGVDGPFTPEVSLVCPEAVSSGVTRSGAGSIRRSVAGVPAAGAPVSCARAVAASAKTTKAAVTLAALILAAVATGLISTRDTGSDCIAAAWGAAGARRLQALEQLSAPWVYFFLPPTTLLRIDPV
jgi:hypothetical protein